MDVGVGQSGVRAIVYDVSDDAGSASWFAVAVDETGRVLKSSPGFDTAGVVCQAALPAIDVARALVAEDCRKFAEEEFGLDAGTACNDEPGCASETRTTMDLLQLLGLPLLFILRSGASPLRRPR